jgi:hypothetical protein
MHNDDVILPATRLVRSLSVCMYIRILHILRVDLNPTYELD